MVPQGRARFPGRPRNPRARPSWLRSSRTSAPRTYSALVFKAHRLIQGGLVCEAHRLSEAGSYVRFADFFITQYYACEDLGAEFARQWPSLRGSGAKTPSIIFIFMRLLYHSTRSRPIRFRITQHVRARFACVSLNTFVPDSVKRPPSSSSLISSSLHSRVNRLIESSSQLFYCHGRVAQAKAYNYYQIPSSFRSTTAWALRTCRVRGSGCVAVVHSSGRVILSPIPR